AYATGCALLAIDTFAAIALQAPDEAMSLAALADAQQNKVYLQRFARTTPGVEWAAYSALVIQHLEEWLQQIPEDIWVSGPALRSYASQLPVGIRVAPPEQWDPQPQSLLRIGLARFLRGERDDLWTV